MQLDAEIESVSRQLGGVAQQDFQPQLTSRHSECLFVSSFHLKKDSPS